MLTRYILGASHDQLGRLYWSTQRGWTYKELASVYHQPVRETIAALPLYNVLEPVWFEVEIDRLGIRRVIGAVSDQPDRGTNHHPCVAELCGEWGRVQRKEAA